MNKKCEHERRAGAGEQIPKINEIYCINGHRTKISEIRYGSV